MESSIYFSLKQVSGFCASLLQVPEWDPSMRILQTDKCTLTSGLAPAVKLPLASRLPFHRCLLSENTRRTEVDAHDTGKHACARAGNGA